MQGDRLRRIWVDMTGQCATNPGACAPSTEQQLPIWGTQASDTSQCAAPVDPPILHCNNGSMRICTNIPMCRLKILPNLLRLQSWFQSIIPEWNNAFFFIMKGSYLEFEHSMQEYSTKGNFWHQVIYCNQL